MFPWNIARTTGLIVNACLRIKPGETVLIAASTEEEIRIAAALAGACRMAEADAGIVIVEPPRRRHEPPEFLAVAMKAVNHIITIGEAEFGHTNARKAASDKGVNYAYIPDLMNEELLALEVQASDLLSAKNLTEEIADAVTGASMVRITSPAGTDIEIPVEGRTGLPLHPIYEHPGHFAIVPFYFEVACPPLENRANGTVVIDGTVVGLPPLNGVPTQPIRWQVERGKITHIEGGREAELLREVLLRAGKNSHSLAELGIGTNDMMLDVLRGNRLDNAIFGHIHLALGRNLDLGGIQDSPIHADFLVTRATVSLDGRPLIEAGRYSSCEQLS